MEPKPTDSKKDFKNETGPDYSELLSDAQAEKGAETEKATLSTVEYETSKNTIVTREIISIGDKPPIVFIKKYESSDEVLAYCPEGTVSAGTDAESVLRAVGEATESVELLDMAQNIHDDKIGEAETAYLDMVTAAMVIDDQGEPNKKLDEAGLSRVALALAGDQEARKLIDSKVIALEKLRADYAAQALEQQKAGLEKQRQEFPETWGVSPEMNPDEVILVHVTKYPPRVDDEGNIILDPTAHYREDVNRSTIHFTTNAVVSDHVFGSGWDDTEKRYVTLVSLGDLIRSGQAPIAVNPVDTYFGVNPGEPLKISGGTILEPIKGESSDDSFRRVKESMHKLGAKVIYGAGPHYLTGGLSLEDNTAAMSSEEFSRRLSIACTERDIPNASLHMGSSDSNLELAYTAPEEDSYDPSLSSVMYADKSTWRYAVLNGNIRVSHITKTDPYGEIEL